MLETLESIAESVLTAIYQQFWFSVLSAALFMFLFLYAREHGWKESFKIWKTHFKKDSQFQSVFLFVFFCIMILMRTLLNRAMWFNPIYDVLGGWTLHNANGELSTEPIENVLLMFPFAFLLLWVFRNQLLKMKTLRYCVWQSTKYTFLFSTIIEFLQLFLRLGTFQLADIFYNTLGGFLGGIFYYLIYKVQGKKEI